MSNQSNQQFNSFYSSSYEIIPNKRQDFRQLKIPFILCLSPFHVSDENDVKFISFPYLYAPRCYKCNSISFPPIIRSSKYGKPSKWECPICHQQNVFRSSYLKLHPDLEPAPPVVDFFYPFSNHKITNKQPTFNFQNKSFLFVLELTASTQKHQFFHESLVCIKKQMENRDEDQVSIFIINSHLLYPTIHQKDVSLTSTYDINDNLYPPIEKLFFNLADQKQLFLEFIDYVDKSVQNNSLQANENTDVSLLDVLQNISKLISNKNIKCVFLVSQIVKDNENHSLFKIFKELTFSMMETILPFDFFLIENVFSNQSFDVLREVFCIGNGFVNFYNNSSSQIQFFSEDFSEQINRLHYNKIYINAIMPPSFKIIDIRGCGVRTLENSFSLMTMSLNDSIYYFIDFSGSEIGIGECLNFQFQMAYHDSSGNRRIRIINCPIYSYELATFHINYSVLVSGCINQAIDTAREEDLIDKASETMKKFNQIFTSDKNAKTVFQNPDQQFQINWFYDVMNSSLSNLYLPLFWPFMLGKMPIDIQLLSSPLFYKIDQGNYNFAGPFLLSNMKLDDGTYYVLLPKNRGALFVLSRDNNMSSNFVVEMKNNSELNEKVQQIFPELKTVIIEFPIQSIIDLKRHILILNR
ncbi:hypothetical protein M9Y10_032983 [Tritrichomonas musculus]|uniref:Protein transport protein SEC23 n=1 Tax=Tritrichomonas musculus TaxID=1915356 RepID=A0ABR2GWP3_9EUKA